MHCIPERSRVYNHDSGNRQFAIISNLKASVRGILVDRSSIPISGDSDFGLANYYSKHMFGLTQILYYMKK